MRLVFPFLRIVRNVLCRQINKFRNKPAILEKSFFVLLFATPYFHSSDNLPICSTTEFYRLKSFVKELYDFIFAAED
jgi:hypothetical protein